MYLSKEKFPGFLNKQLELIHAEVKTRSAFEKKEAIYLDWTRGSINFPEVGALEEYKDRDQLPREGFFEILETDASYKNYIDTMCFNYVQTLSDVAYSSIFRNALLLQSKDRVDLSEGQAAKFYLQNGTVFLKRKLIPSVGEQRGDFFVKDATIEVDLFLKNSQWEFESIKVENPFIFLILVSENNLSQEFMSFLERCAKLNQNTKENNELAAVSQDLLKIRDEIAVALKAEIEKCLQKGELPKATIWEETESIKAKFAEFDQEYTDRYDLKIARRIAQEKDKKQQYRIEICGYQKNDFSKYRSEEDTANLNKAVQILDSFIKSNSNKTLEEIKAENKDTFEKCDNTIRNIESKKKSSINDSVSEKIAGLLDLKILQKDGKKSITKNICSDETKVSLDNIKKALEEGENLDEVKSTHDIDYKKYEILNEIFNTGNSKRNQAIQFFKKNTQALKEFQKDLDEYLPGIMRKINEYSQESQDDDEVQKKLKERIVGVLKDRLKEVEEKLKNPVELKTGSINSSKKNEEFNKLIDSLKHIKKNLEKALTELRQVNVDGIDLKKRDKFITEVKKAEILLVDNICNNSKTNTDYLILQLEQLPITTDKITEYFKSVKDPAKEKEQKRLELSQQLEIHKAKAVKDKSAWEKIGKFALTGVFAAVGALVGGALGLAVSALTGGVAAPAIALGALGGAQAGVAAFAFFDRWKNKEEIEQEKAIDKVLDATSSLIKAY